ncbi:MAG: MBL fold metallo-hydrolase [Planctomycetes bacterium]|nr:MBL fold metallo-hydrolase [Planctomycetota bacterium]
MKLGSVNINIVSDGFFRLDGGAMFGIVPKALWEKRISADEQNRIQMGLWCLAIQAGGKNILINTGVGPNEKYNKRFLEIYAIQHPPDLFSSLAACDLKPEDIDMVVNTHLHFDHSGYNTVPDGNNKFKPAFPNAKYIVQKAEWEKAVAPTVRTRASYRPENIMPLKEYGVLELIDGEKEIAPGVKVKPTGGHTRGHQVILFSSGGKKGVFWSDLIPTTAHLDLPYAMSYDLYPEETMESKGFLIEQAVKEKWICFWEHDPKINCGYLERKGDKIEVLPAECK